MKKALSLVLAGTIGASAAVALLLPGSGLFAPKVEVPSAEEIHAAFQNVVGAAKAKVAAGDAPGVTPPPAITLQPVPGATGESKARLFSLASFDYDELDECADFGVSPIGEGSTEDTNAVVQRVADFYSGRGVDFVQVPKMCADQFAGRPVLAICLVQQNRASMKVTAAFSYYQSYTIKNKDVHMRNCLKLGGTWKLAAEPSGTATAAARN